MCIIENKWRKKTVAMLLQFIFLFPLVFNPLHYLFIDHMHRSASATPVLDVFHDACSLDDFNLGKSADIEPVIPLKVILVEFKFLPLKVAEAILFYHNYTFLLRAPPFSLLYL